MSIENRVKTLVSDQLKVSEDKIKLESKFIEDLNADSLDFTELVMALEDEFQISIADEDLEKIRTVGDVIEYVKSHS
jgi:acyl carrier protein